MAITTTLLGKLPIFKAIDGDKVTYAAKCTIKSARYGMGVFWRADTAAGDTQLVGEWRGTERSPDGKLMAVFRTNVIANHAVYKDAQFNAMIRAGQVIQKGWGVGIATTATVTFTAA